MTQTKEQLFSKHDKHHVFMSPKCDLAMPRPSAVPCHMCSYVGDSVCHNIMVATFLYKKSLI